MLFFKRILKVTICFKHIILKEINTNTFCSDKENNKGYSKENDKAIKNTQCAEQKEEYNCVETVEQKTPKITQRLIKASSYLQHYDTSSLVMNLSAEIIIDNVPATYDQI